MRVLVTDERGTIDYSSVERSLDTMAYQARTIADLNPSPEMKQQLSQLIRMIQAAKGHAKRHEQSAIEKDVSLLAEKCFTCHAAHRDR